MYFPGRGVLGITDNGERICWSRNFNLQVVVSLARQDLTDCAHFAALAARVRRIAMIAASYFRLGVDSH
jgi:hypothetical protein